MGCNQIRMAAGPAGCTSRRRQRPTVFSWVERRARVAHSQFPEDGVAQRKASARATGESWFIPSRPIIHPRLGFGQHVEEERCGER
jgi:hypothetical protein